MEVMGIGVMLLIGVALLFNATKPGLNATTNKVGNTLNAVGSGNSLPNQINP